MIEAIRDACRALKSRNVWLLSLTLGIIIATHESWYPLLPVYLKKLGATDMEVGLSYTFFAFSYALFQFLGGILADRFGRKTLIIAPMFITSVIWFLISQVTNWKWLVALIVLSSLFSAFQWPSFIGLLAESVEEKLRGSAFAVFEIAIALGIACGTFMGYKLYQTLGVSNLIVITAIASFLGAIIRLFGLQETMKRKDNDSKFNLKAMCKQFNPALYWCFAGMVGFGLLSSISLNGPFITLHAKEHMGLTGEQVYLIFLVAGASAIVTAPFSGWLADRFGPKVIFIAGGVGHGLMLIPWMLSGSFYLSLPFVFFSASTLQAGAIAKNALISKLTTPAYRASLVGFAGTIAGLTASVGPTIGMKLRELLGPYAPFAFAFLVGIGTMLVLLPIKMPQNGEVAH